MKRPPARPPAAATAVPAAAGGVRLAALVAAVGWTWAVLLLAGRLHLTLAYDVRTPLPPLWGFLALPLATMLLVVTSGVALGLACAECGTRSHRAPPVPTRWLAAAWFVPLLDALRWAGLNVPHTMFEPLLIAAISGAAVTSWARTVKAKSPPSQQPAKAPWLYPTVICLAGIACGVWWTYQGLYYYSAYLLGYNDFGHFAWRVASTWAGRGFLEETPGLPAFWDHFNPGLALLAPLWGVWPDARLFIVLQAICLASVGPLVYVLARAMGAGRGAACAWGGAALVYPALGQLNLTYGYGWHPVSLVLPLLPAALIALARRRLWLAAAAAVLAMSFQEDVIALLACLAVALALDVWLRQRQTPVGRTGPMPQAAPAECLPWQVWLALALALTVIFVVVWKTSAFSRFQASRFVRLGSSPAEVIASPVLRPGAFWGTVFQLSSLYLLLALAVPLGIRNLARGWPVLVALILPFGVLLAWPHPPATSIAFHYTTTLIPVLMLAALSGAARRQGAETGGKSSEGRDSDRFLPAGLGALAAGAVASTFFGALPWSSPTLTDMIGVTYGVATDSSTCRAPGMPAHATLQGLARDLTRHQASVLATGRVASHLLGASRLDTVAQFQERQAAYHREIGPDRDPIELFDWIILDTRETFYQKPEQTQRLLDLAQEKGFTITQSEHDILVLTRAE